MLYPVVEFEVEGKAQVESKVQVKHSAKSERLPYKGTNPGCLPVKTSIHKRTSLGLVLSQVLIHGISRAGP
jgi:hypothetical protein